MKAKSIWTMGIVGVVVITIVAVIVTMALNSQKTSAPDSQSDRASQKITYSPPKACDILTLDAARKIDAGVAANDTPSSDVSSNSISVSNCNYYNITTKVSVGLLVRGAKNSDGAESNDDQFKSLPVGAQSVDKYGDVAYWDPAFGQLNILKNNNWYIISSGLATPKDRTLEEAKKLADIISDKL